MITTTIITIITITTIINNNNNNNKQQQQQQGLVLQEMNSELKCFNKNDIQDLKEFRKNSKN